MEPEDGDGERPPTDAGPSGESSVEPFDATYDPDSSRTPSSAVVDAVAAVTNADPMDLPPLYDSVDTDALDAFVESEAGAASGLDSNASLRFTFSGTVVTVSDDGEITVEVSDVAGTSET
jgi:hypothetical protein